ncbi:3 beta-hydroxysteroid dehydrogenase type 7, partial [Cichlidogyrus casuarinus]
MDQQCLTRLENGIKPTLDYHKCPDYGCPVEAPWPEAPSSNFTAGDGDARKISVETVLVIGGAGFLGRHIIYNLADSIPELRTIRILDRQALPSGFKVPSSILGPKVSIEFVHGDIRDKRKVREAFHCVDAVIHVASIIAVGPSQDERYTYSTNIRGTKNVLELLNEFSIHILVYTSSALCTRTWDEVEDESEQEWDRDQYDQKRLVFPVYGTSKIAAESLIRKACSKEGQLRAICLRPSGIYGEGDYLYVPSMILAAKNNRGVMVKLGAGKRPKIQRIYAGNCAWAHVHALRCLANATNLNQINGHAFHIADGTPTMPNEEFSQPFLK